MVVNQVNSFNDNFFKGNSDKIVNTTHFQAELFEDATRSLTTLGPMYASVELFAA